MMSAFELAEMAKEMQSAQDRGFQISPFTARFPDFDVAAAYTVADLVHRERLRQGIIPVGRKIGFSNAALWPVYGVTEPIWGYVYDTTVEFASQARVHCSLQRFAEPLIEPEIVVHFGTAPEPASGPAGVLASIDWIAHGFEIVQSHFPSWKFRAADTIADGGLHARLLVGKPQYIDRLGSDVLGRLGRFTLSLFRDNEQCDSGTGSNVLGNPLRAIAHLMDALSTQPLSPPLRAGELVTTGTITAAHPIRAGERWHTELTGIALPGLAVEFA